MSLEFPLPLTLPPPLPPTSKVKYVSEIPHQRKTILCCAQYFMGVGVFRNHF